jgi:1-acyl-sn-glycerol-3-phosphate acyltransferase
VTRRLYDAVALSLGAYARSRFRVCPLGDRFRLEPHGLVVCTHRSDADVPVLISVLYPHAHGRLRLRGRELQFAVRDDLFLRGFFAGYAPGLPPLVRRLLFPLGVGGILRRRLPCHPLRSATRMRLVELLREHRETPLCELVPEQMLPQRLDSDARARKVLRGRNAEWLWQVVDEAELTGMQAEESWRRRRAAALADFRELVALVRNGGTLLLFPEGRPSPDGALGPVQPGIAALVRRAKPASMQPIALAYDPLVRTGRPFVYVGIGEPVEPTTDDAEVLALLRRTTPLTAGQLVATGSAQQAEREVEAALAAGRPVAPELLDPERRRVRIEEARSAAAGRDLGRLALEYRSART